MVFVPFDRLILIDPEGTTVLPHCAVDIADISSIIFFVLFSINVIF